MDVTSDRPETFRACFNLGNVLYRMGRPEEAAQRFMQTVEIDGNYVEAWKWFDRAAAAGVGDAAEWLMKVDAKLTPRERAEIDGAKEP